MEVLHSKEIDWNYICISVTKKKLSLARHLEIRVFVFFGKKPVFFKSLRKNFTTGFVVRRVLCTSKKKRFLKSRQKTDAELYSW